MHRIAWSFVFTIILVSALNLWRAVIEAVFDKHRAKYFLISSVLVAANWLLFVYGVFLGEVLELSLALYLNPIFNVCFGVLFFRERMSALTKFAVGLVVLGLSFQFMELTEFPYLAFVLALVFSLYGATRKRAPVDAVSGLFIETAILMPVAVLYLVVWGRESSLALMQESWQWAGLLMLAGPLTSLPLISFAMALKRLPYYLVGFCQYITPTIIFFMAVYLFGERISGLDVVTFGLVWAGIILSVTERLRENFRPSAEIG